MSHGRCQHRILDAGLHTDNASPEDLGSVECVDMLEAFSLVVAVPLESLWRRQSY
jgi:hypothetical protein